MGNIPYDVDDSKLQEIFSTVGPVKSLRRVGLRCAARTVGGAVLGPHRNASGSSPRAGRPRRLVNDKDTGKPKGYGFCEYFDPATAESAVRNLNGHEVNGRSLRCVGLGARMGAHGAQRM